MLSVSLSDEFYLVSRGFTGFYRFLPSFNEFSTISIRGSVVPSIPSFSFGLNILLTQPSFTYTCLVLPSLPSFTGFYHVLPAFTSFTYFYRV